MKSISTIRLVSGTLASLALVLLAVLGSMSLAAQDKYTVKVPDGSRFPILEDTRTGRMWQSVRPKLT